MRWPKYLDKYPTAVIAERVGVKPATVKRWQRTGRIPKAQVLAARSVKDIYIQSPARRKRWLRDTHSSVIADVTGATVEQARRWKGKGDIPLQYRLADAFTEGAPKVPKAPKIIGGRTGKVRQTKNFTILTSEWDVEQLLTDSTLLEILRRVSLEKPGEGRFQFAITGSAILEETDYLLMNYTAVEYVHTREPDRATVPFFSSQFSNYPRTIRSLHTTLLRQLPKSMTINSLTLIVTRRKKSLAKKRKS